MVRVKVKVFATLRDRLGWKEREYDVEARSIHDLLKVIHGSGGRLYDIIFDEEKGEILPLYKVLLNGRDIDFLDGLKTKLKDQDLVFIFPPVGGG